MSTVDFANLYTRLAACSRARESAVALDRNQAGTSSDSGSVELTHNIKQEVAYTQSCSSARSRRDDNGSQRSRSPGRRYEKYCSGCGRQGHSVRACPDALCYRCRGRGRISRDCRVNLDDKGHDHH